MPPRYSSPEDHGEREPEDRADQLGSGVTSLPSTPCPSPPRTGRARSRCPRGGRRRTRGREREAAGDERRLDLLLELGLDPRALTSHPEDHPRQHTDRGERHEPFEDLLGPAFELRAGDEDHQPRARRSKTGSRVPAPTTTRERSARPHLLQVRQHDRDDQRCLDALAEGDHEGRSHRSLPSSRGSRVRCRRGRILGSGSDSRQSDSVPNHPPPAPTLDEPRSSARGGPR